MEFGILKCAVVSQQRGKKARWEGIQLHIFLYISNLVAKAPGLYLGKKLSNLLSNHEALN